MKKTELTPQRVFDQFAKINTIPRPSKHEEKMIAYLTSFGKDHGLPTKVDATGNVLISKPATPGYENRATVVLQSHMDMVCDKLVDREIDFMNDPIETCIDGEWLKAKGTTLGADDGIGVAIELAILASDDICHGPIECLFTVDEETGLTGAFGLEAGFMSGDMLINLDSEDEGQIFVSCAGGLRLDCSGASKLNFGKVRCESLRGVLSGASNLTLAANVDGSIDLDNSGACKQYLQLVGKTLKMESSGATNSEISFKGGSADVSCSGAGKVQLDVDCKELKASNSGASKFTISGTADKTDIDASGVAKIDTKQLNKL